jgi:hypothetical protein
MDKQPQNGHEQNEDLNMGIRKGFWLFAGLHLLCCGIPLLLLTGISFTFVWPSWPVIGSVLMLLGITGFAWYMKLGWATCSRNQGKSCSIKIRNEMWPIFKSGVINQTDSIDRMNRQ